MCTKSIQALVLCVGFLSVFSAQAAREYHKVDSPGPVKYCCSACISYNSSGVCTNFSQCETGTTGLGYCPAKVKAVNPLLPAKEAGSGVRNLAPELKPEQAPKEMREGTGK
ncbi:hypothetical protein [Lysobacter enzymogenes]|uniref:hypothetical protein n=1 Tax=Lysobacter enzymogenes TaxID=69 RepID=UPI00089B0FA3|nr:hypothetical protein [Lysobacter enzymogenes]SDX72686.1 hypothetical protein SAMN05421681_107149 [Lysobacter enzymogenes]